MEVPLYWLKPDVGGSLIKKGHHFVMHFFYRDPDVHSSPLCEFSADAFHVNFSNRFLLANAYLSKRSRIGFVNDLAE